MEFRSTAPISKMGAGFGDNSEIVNVDSLRMMSIVVNHATKTLQFAFAWGGYSSDGCWHMVPVHLLPAAARSISASVPGEKEIWEACTQDDKGNPILDHGCAFVRKVLIDHGKLADIINGGWPIKGMTLTADGQIVGAHDEKGVFRISQKDSGK